MFKGVIISATKEQWHSHLRSGGEETRTWGEIETILILRNIFSKELQLSLCSNFQSWNPFPSTCLFSTPRWPPPSRCWTMAWARRSCHRHYTSQHHHNHNHYQGLWTRVSGEQLCGLVQRQPGHPPRGHHHLLVHCHKSLPWVYVAFPAALREWQAVDHREDRFGAEAQHASQDHFLRKKFLIMDLRKLNSVLF